MAKRGNKKVKIDSNEAFQQYKIYIVNHPTYSGMPDAIRDDGTIQWEAPSNRQSGIFQFTHDKRTKWWENKAKEIGISINEDKWISKVAKKIHPTGKRPCPICGKVLEIRYAYLSKNFINRVKKLPFYNHDITMTEVTHILDFVREFVSKYDKNALKSLPALLKCNSCKIDSSKNLPTNLSDWLLWIDKVYIPSEPEMLGPGAMSNAPDRFDGFHYNRCCRPSADKGRSKENLASYSTDRRAFENWSDGNWITANKLMGYINSNPTMKKEYCANDDETHSHPRPCSADHIGPISLGFCHRPEFQFLCKSCNSAKNNRMYFSDVLHLIETEKNGITVTSWYAKSIWEMCKDKVHDKESALRLSRVMRDNRNIALMLLADFLNKKEYLFLLTLMHLEYADFDYDIIPNSTKIINHIITADFSRTKSALRYVTIQKTRKIRVAFSSLFEYARKDNRNGYMYTNDDIKNIKNDIFIMLTNVDKSLIKINEQLISLLTTPDVSDVEIEKFIGKIDYNKIKNDHTYTIAREKLSTIMAIVAREIAANWDSPRYSREILD